MGSFFAKDVKRDKKEVFDEETKRNGPVDVGQRRWQTWSSSIWSGNRSGDPFWHVARDNLEIMEEVMPSMPAIPRRETALNFIPSLFHWQEASVFHPVLQLAHRFHQTGMKAE